MSHFYSSCEGGRGAATRCGHKTTGIKAYVQSAQCGIKVNGDHDEKTGLDVFQVTVYSNQYGRDSITIPLKVYCSNQRDDIQVVHYGRKGDYNTITESQTTFEFMDELSSEDDISF